MLQQDSFIEDQRQALNERLTANSSRHSSSSSLSSSSSSRPSSLIEQEKHRSLERQRQEAASLQVDFHCCFLSDCSKLIVYNLVFNCLVPESHNFYCLFNPLLHFQSFFKSYRLYNICTSLLCVSETTGCSSGRKEEEREGMGVEGERSGRTGGKAEG